MNQNAAATVDNAVPYWRLSAFYFFYFAILGVLVPYWPLYLSEIGFEPEQIGIMVAIVMGTKLIGPNFWGWLADKTGRHLLTIKIACLIATLSFIPLIWLRDFWPMALTLTFSTFFWNAALPQQEVITTRHLGDHGDYGRVRMWGSIGFVLSVLGVGPIVAWQGPAIILPICVAGFALLSVCSLITPEPNKQVKETERQPLHDSLFRPAVIALLLTCFFIQVSHGAYYGFFSLHLKAQGYGESLIGVIWSLGVISEIAIFVWMGTLFKRFSLRNLMIISAAATAIRWQVVAWLPDVAWILIPSQVLHMATFGIYHAVAIQLVRKHFPDSLQGQGQALYSSISFGLGGAVGAWLSGYLWANYLPHWTWLAASLSGLLGLLVASYALEREQISSR